jgi:hypothetical protein
MGNVDGEHEFHAGEMVVDLSHPLLFLFFPVGNGVRLLCIHHVNIWQKW